MSSVGLEMGSSGVGFKPSYNAVMGSQKLGRLFICTEKLEREDGAQVVILSEMEAFLCLSPSSLSDGMALH